MDAVEKQTGWHGMIRQLLHIPSVKAMWALGTGPHCRNTDALLRSEERRFFFFFFDKEEA